MPKLIAGNWKMNNTTKESLALIRDLKNKIKKIETKNEIVICPPFVSLHAASKEIINSRIMLGAQNMHFMDSGAYTGEISPMMLKEIGCKYVIIGHSERRQYFNENDELINKKVKAAIQHNLMPILCIGEKLGERQKNIQKNIVEKQLINALQNTEKNNLNSLVVAYEPVWAIGTGKNATPEQAEEMHLFIRKVLEKQFGNPKIKILYGGSVNEKNAKGILRQKNVDGALVGGASLKADSFIEIINSG